MQSSLSVPLTSARRFRVRDLSSHYGAPTFDLVFYDAENGVERHSEAVWNSQEQAILEAEHLDAAQLRPVHWEVCGQNSGDLVNF
ncbi:hypothetical protein [Azotobacter salinestris]|uniref:hypothetical protein n=1 Tax=Azotobacter salinestris TaxID=69964 RepID=UPI001AD7776F|nr:hypothetical protein [Azotobacter salinestris]